MPSGAVSLDDVDLDQADFLNYLKLLDYHDSTVFPYMVVFLPSYWR
ncbi:hypothetical protein RDI58_015126 [Solanum bulbocastanum]|uniref:Uncharacterized protein n=1 Tax=Solanum bulbocastanum TaxID=147425 RepID=A0AAN8TJK8_SOLBU